MLVLANKSLVFRAWFFAVVVVSLLCASASVYAKKFDSSEALHLLQLDNDLDKNSVSLKHVKIDVLCGYKTKLSCVVRHTYQMSAVKRQWTTFAITLVKKPRSRSATLSMDIRLNDKRAVKVSRWNPTKIQDIKVAKFKARLNSGNNTLTLTKTLQPGHFAVAKNLASKTVGSLFKKNEYEPEYLTHYFPIHLSHWRRWKTTSNFSVNFEISLLHDGVHKSIFNRNEVFAVVPRSQCKTSPLPNHCVKPLEVKPVITNKLTTYSQTLTPKSDNGLLLLFSPHAIKAKKIHADVLSYQ